MLNKNNKKNPNLFVVGDFLFNSFAVEDKLCMFAFQILDLRFKAVVLVDALFKVAQQYGVAQQAAVLLKATIVDPQ